MQLLYQKTTANLSKFEGVQMLGGVTLNGAKLFEDTGRHRKVRRTNSTCI